jgi:hypothetical protein
VSESEKRTVADLDKLTGFPNESFTTYVSDAVCVPPDPLTAKDVVLAFNNVKLDAKPVTIGDGAASVPVIIVE